MPRTKAPNKKRTTNAETNNNMATKQLKKEILLRLQETEKSTLKKIEEVKNQFTLHMDAVITEILTKISKKNFKLTIEEVRLLPESALDATASTNITANHTINLTKLNKNTRKVTRSSSLDEGYLSVESAHSGRGRIKGRPKVTSKRTSRSATKFNDLVCSTPINQPVSNAYGIITPKCQPNESHVLLRRPKKGEIVVSMQGSPVLSAPVGTDEVANVNIPLSDGTLLSLLPMRGLRLSTIPTLPSDTIDQLNTLYKHVGKVLTKNNNTSSLSNNHIL